MSEAPATLAAVREKREVAHSPAAILAAQAANVLDRMRGIELPRRIEILQIAIALTAAEIQDNARKAQPRDE